MKPDPLVEKFAQELSEKVHHYATPNQYVDGSAEQKAYLDGVSTAMGMAYIDLTGSPKSKGMVQTLIDALTKGADITVCPIHGNAECHVEPSHLCYLKTFDASPRCNCACTCTPPLTTKEDGNQKSL